MANDLYKAKFIIEGQQIKLTCRGTEQFENIKNRLWKKKGLTLDKSQYVFKLKNFPRHFSDFETFQRLVAVFGGGVTEKIEALVVKKSQLTADTEFTKVHVTDDGTVPIQGYLDLMSGLTDSATATRRYFVLKNDSKLGPTLLYFANERSFYDRERPIASLGVANAQALKVDGVKYTFQLLRLEDQGKPGKTVLRGADDNSKRCWLQAMRQMNYNNTKAKGLQSVVWVPDASVVKCMRCDLKFTLTKRKHHCRLCGAVVCGECSNYKLSLVDVHQDIRVCKHCYKDYRKETKKPKKKQQPTEDDEDDDEPPPGPPPEEEEAPASPSSKSKEKIKQDELGLRANVRDSMRSSLEGYLKKQSPKGLKPWQKRYFVLDEPGKKISYYKDRKNRLLGEHGEIDLKDVRDCFHLKDDRLRFDIVTARKSYQFEAPTPGDSTRWVTHIMRIVRDINGAKDEKPLSSTVRLTQQSASQARKKDEPKPIFLESILKKKHKSQLFTKWQERYFILNQASKTITYFKKNPKVFPEEQVLGTIDFLDIAQCKTDFTDRKMPQFCIWMKTGRQYSLACVKEADATNWAKSITTCIQAAQPPSSSKPVLPTSLRPGTGKGKKGFPQLTDSLETKDVIPIVLRIMSFVSQDELIVCVRLSRFWKVIATEVIANGQETDDSGSEEGDDNEDDQNSGEDEEEDGGLPPIVIDNGAHIIRAGFAGEEVPKILLSQASGGVLDPKLVAESKGTITVQLDSMNHFADNPATWKLLEKTWKSLFALMKVDPSKHKILVTQPLMAPKALVENMQRILFEKFRCPLAHVAVAPILTCYGYGKWTGLVVDIGHTSAQVCPIVDGYLKEGSVRRAPHLGGENLTRRMYEFLKFSSISKLPIMEALGIAQGIKEKYCFCPKDYAKDVKDEKYKITYKLPAGETITIQRAIVNVGEMYFDPAKVTGDRDQSNISIQELVGQVVDISEIDTRQELVSNILLSGGGTMMKGFVERFEYELKEHLPHLADSIKIVADKDRQNGVWRGGAVLANLDSFQKKWTKREEWAVR